MKIRKAVIPAAGLGMRMFPASQAVKKELFPVVGPDGIARALIHYHILELLAAGIEEIAVIIQQIYARYKAGFTKDKRFAGLIFAVQVLGRMAVKVIEKGRIDDLGS